MADLDRYLNKVTCGDCLELMRELPDKCVDFIWTDPPYNVGKDYGEYKDNLSDDKYLCWMNDIVCQCKRISKHGMAIMVPQKYMLQLWQILGEAFHQIILSYTPEGAFRFGFVNQFTSILVNRTPLQYCKNVWHNLQMPALGWFFRENTFEHPCYTSEDITINVLSFFTKIDEIILDPFLGSGTTAVAAERLGRQWIGFEISSEYCEIAERRKANERAQLKLKI